MMDVLVAAMLIQTCAVGWFGVIRLTRTVRLTSLTAAVNWAIWFQATLTVTTIATLFKGRVSPGILDQLWYLTAVSALCPFVAVLGARRGRLLEWSFFIVLPLIVVLEWPALAQLTRCWHGQRLELETPAVIAYGFVLLMSGSSVCGTDRMAYAFGSWLMAWCIVVGACWSSLDLSWIFCNGQDLANRREIAFGIVPFCLVIFWTCEAFAIRRPSPYSSWDRVWFDFQKYFGGLWATRLASRINEVAEREQWPWRVMPSGLQPAARDAPHPGSPDGDPRVDHTFRWLLKPFVDPEWINERLTASTDRAAGD